MKTAIPVWDDCVSSAFDFAHRLLLVDIENGTEVSRSEISLTPESIHQRAARLKALGIDVLICGAISRSLASQVAASGIEVLPYVVGQVDEILRAYLAGQLSQPQFAMPGYWKGARKDFACGRRRCRRQARRGKTR
jgi:predicted Fe-Mo cluster-binding NifX family protein